MKIALTALFWLTAAMFASAQLSGHPGFIVWAMMFASIVPVVLFVGGKR